MPRLYLIRHAEPAITGVFLGTLDPPLSDAGRAAARGVMPAIDAAILYSSPRRRAVETAEAHGGLPVVVVPELAEMAFGEWEGRTWAEILRDDPELAARKQANWFGAAPRGGETWDEVRARAAVALGLVRRGPLPAAVVAHGALNSAMHELITGEPAAAVRQRYLEIHTYEL